MHCSQNMIPRHGGPIVDPFYLLSFCHCQTLVTPLPTGNFSTSQSRSPPGFGSFSKCDSVFSTQNMASACINNIGLSPDNFLDCSYAWLACEMPSNHNPEKLSDLPEEPDLDLSDIADFEFRLEDPVMMLPADQLFSDGKLIPLQEATSLTTTPPDTSKPRRRMNGVSVADPFLYSPKAPRCSSRWKELLGLRKLYQNNSNDKQDTNRTSSSAKSIKNFLHRSSKSSNDSSVNLPLLKDTDSEPTSRLSLSSSSSGHDPDEVPRVSVDSEKPGKVNNPPRMGMVKTRRPSGDVRGVSIDSPRMNSSGKIVFQSLERSSSSPSSFNGGLRFKHRGMERSYSANVRVTPVLNVPVCSLRKSGGVFGLPLFSSPQKRDGNGRSQQQVINGKIKTERS